ncbi:MAG: imidazole glycerol phosphate synthase subunit HisH [Alphaproteobacteria bacterium]|nr:imidazole glycerol phosphate synthase subunit HisH [Alphaproteobacteria bacterium]
MTRIAIIDYGLCNLDSIARALAECGADPFVTSDPSALDEAEKIVLPGVGAFAKAMENLRTTGMDVALNHHVVDGGKSFLGICLGMQLMANGSEEGQQAAGLGWVDATVVKLEAQSPGDRVPHVGWNEVDAQEGAALFSDIDHGTDFYFVHSYHMRCNDEGIVVSRTPYCGEFVSAVARDNIQGVQFHPEKSQKMGFRLLKNFLEL